MTNAAFTTATINLLPSTSLKAWAQTAHNLPLIKAAAKAAQAKGQTPQDLATYLTVVAMGM